MDSIYLLLFQFDEYSSTILRVQEYNWLSMGTDLRLLCQRTDSLRFDQRHGLIDVLDLHKGYGR